MNLTIYNTDNVIKSIDRITNKKIKNLQQAMKNVSFFLESEIKESIAGRRSEPPSVDTGTFLQRVHTTQIDPYTYTIGDGVEYGQFLEMGTSKLKPRRHFRNSLNRNNQKLQKHIKQSLA